MWARLVGTTVVVQLTEPSALTIDAVYVDGRSQPITRQHLPPGEHRISLEARLHVLPHGVLFFRISDTRRVATIPFVR